MTYRRPARDLTGLKFGSLTVLGRAPEYNMWRCRCSCGEIVVSQHGTITKTKDVCWCSRRKRPNKIIVADPEKRHWPAGVK